MTNLEQTIEKSFLDRFKSYLGRVRSSAISKLAVYSLVGVLSAGLGCGCGGSDIDEFKTTRMNCNGCSSTEESVGFMSPLTETSCRYQKLLVEGDLSWWTSSDCEPQILAHTCIYYREDDFNDEWDPVLLRIQEEMIKIIEEEESCGNYQNLQRLQDCQRVQEIKEKNSQIKEKYSKEIEQCEEWYGCGLDHNVPGFACHNELAEHNQPSKNGCDNYYKGMGSEYFMPDDLYLRKHATEMNSKLLIHADQRWVNQACQVNNLDELEEAVNLARGGDLPDSLKKKVVTTSYDTPAWELNGICDNITWAYEHICMSGWLETKDDDDEIILVRQGRINENGVQESWKFCDEDDIAPSCNTWVKDEVGCPHENGNMCKIYKKIECSFDCEEFWDSINTKDNSTTWPFDLNIMSPLVEEVTLP